MANTQVIQSTLIDMVREAGPLTAREMCVRTYGCDTYAKRKVMFARVVNARRVGLLEFAGFDYNTDNKSGFFPAKWRAK